MVLPQSLHCGRLIPWPTPRCEPFVPSAVDDPDEAPESPCPPCAGPPPRAVPPGLHPSAVDQENRCARQRPPQGPEWGHRHPQDRGLPEGKLELQEERQTNPEPAA